MTEPESAVPPEKSAEPRGTIFQCHHCKGYISNYDGLICKLCGKNVTEQTAVAAQPSCRSCVHWCDMVEVNRKAGARIPVYPEGSEKYGAVSGTVRPHGSCDAISRLYHSTCATIPPRVKASTHDTLITHPDFCCSLWKGKTND